MRQRAAVSILLVVICFITRPAAPDDRSAVGSTDGYWMDKQVEPILSKTLRVHLEPSLDHLTDGERAALNHLIEVGSIMHDLYLESRHKDALSARRSLEKKQNLKDLFWLSKGPIVTSLTNERVPFMPVAEEAEGKNVYPWGITREEVDNFLEAYPESAASVMHLRHVVRRTTAENLNRDVEMLEKYPALDVLHPGLVDRLRGLLLKDVAPPLYGVPYSVAYAPKIHRAHRLLHRAADAIEGDDPAFSRFLRNRARDLLTDDYESGDASWVSGDFGNLNAQIGSYETYDDALYGVKSFFSLCIFVRDIVRSDELSKALGNIQALENSLPYNSARKIADRVPVGVYNVVADFGQSRGANTATILPNEGYLTTQYGRTILIRGNIISDDRIFKVVANAFEAAVDRAHHADLTKDGKLYGTFWHEVGHYLGPASTRDGHEIASALGRASNALEEMKSDLISLFAVQSLVDAGFYDESQARSVYASGILRVLAKNRPRRDQNYGTMQLIQFNWFLKRGLIEFDAEQQNLRIDYSKYHDTVVSLLAEVLKLQLAGDEAEAERFIKSHTSWDEAVNGALAEKLKAAESYRYIMVTYDSIDPP